MFCVVNSQYIVCGPADWDNLALRQALYLAGCVERDGIIHTPAGDVVPLPETPPGAAVSLTSELRILPVVDVTVTPTATQAVSGYDLVVAGDTVERRWRVVDVPQPSLDKPALTPYEFACRFTLGETAAILALTKTDTMAEAIQKRFDVAQAIDLTLADVTQGLAYFVQAGALTAERAQQIAAVG